jgi:hypothetical protein
VNAALWVVTPLLAAAMGAAGVAKFTHTYAEIVTRIPWAEDFTAGSVRAIGAAELASVAGLVLPHWTGITPWLTPVTAGCVAALMIGAIGVHLQRHETTATIGPALLLVLALTVAIGRVG